MLSQSIFWPGNIYCNVFVVRWLSGQKNPDDGRFDEEIVDSTPNNKRKQNKIELFTITHVYFV